MKILFVLLSYLLGAVPTGYLLFRLSEKKDVREFGSRNTGATNIMRLKGWKYAVPVALFDVFKGFLPPFLAIKVFNDPLLALVSSFLAILGHCYPVYIRFRGGKGVAATIGAFAVIAVKPFLISLVLFVLVVVLTRYVSLASILAGVSFPLLVWAFQASPATIVWGVGIAALIVLKHLENIRRLLNHEERKFGERTS